MIRLVEEIGAAIVIGLSFYGLILKQWFAARAVKRDLERQEADEVDHAHETTTSTR